MKESSELPDLQPHTTPPDLLPHRRYLSNLHDHTNATYHQFSGSGDNNKWWSTTMAILGFSGRQIFKGLRRCDTRDDWARRVGGGGRWILEIQHYWN
uniref:Uncharacterized protein n=3 Tax=Cucumis melo TaxID=3656 RepID=A0A9I9DUS3_CUCME